MMCNTPEIKSRSHWILENAKSVIKDKDRMVQHLIFNMLNKTNRLFKYNNLPDTIPAKDLETLLQVGGFAVFKDVNGELYAFTAGLGGKPNPYYLPTIATIANPALNYNAQLEIDKECVVMLNDHYYQGMMPLFVKYAELLADAEITLRYAIINARIPAIVQADNQGTYESALAFFDNVEKGKSYGIVMSNDFFDGITTMDYYGHDYIKADIEAIQYIKGSWYNEIGLNAAFNMKREAINEAEATLNENILFPGIEAMLDCRKIGLEKVNKMFGTDISVEFDSVWAKNLIHDELSIELQEAIIDETEATAEATSSVEEVETDEDTRNTDE